MGPGGLEPPTSRLSVVRSSQLSYGPSRSRAISYNELLRSVKHYFEAMKKVDFCNIVRGVIVTFMNASYQIKHMSPAFDHKRGNSKTS